MLILELDVYCHRMVLSSKLVKFQICLIFLCKLTRLTLKGHNSDIIWTTGMFDTSMESSCHPLSAYVTVWPLRSKIKGKKITYMWKITTWLLGAPDQFASMWCWLKPISTIHMGPIQCEETKKLLCIWLLSPRIEER